MSDLEMNKMKNNNTYKKDFKINNNISCGTKATNRWKRFRQAVCLSLSLCLIMELFSLSICSDLVLAKDVQAEEVFNSLENERTANLSGGMVEPQFQFEEIDSQTSAISDNSVDTDEEIGVSANDILFDDKYEIGSEQVAFAIEQDAVDYIRKQLVNRNTNINFTFTTKGTFDSAKVKKIVSQAFEDDLDGAPNEGDYLYWHIRNMSFQLAKKSSNTYQVKLVTTFLSNASQEKYVASEVEKIVKELDLLSVNKTDYEKIKAIYDYLIDRIEYDHDNYRNNASSYLPMYAAYSGLQDGKTVCQGYASLTYRICKRIGIPVRLIAGRGMSQNHGWNIVKLGDRYYNIDVTWDDEGKTSSYKYFMKNMEDFANHTRFDNYTGSAFDAKFLMAKYSLSFTDSRYNLESKIVSFDNPKGKYIDLDKKEFDITANDKLRLYMFVNPENNTYYQAMALALRNGNNIKRCDITIFDTFQHYEKYTKTSFDMMSNLKQYLQLYVNARIIPSTSETIKLKNTYEKLANMNQTTEGAYVIIDGKNKVRYVATAQQGLSEIEDICKKLVDEVKNIANDSSVITGFSVSQITNDKVRLKWNSVQGADTYLVYRKDSGKNYICLGTTDSTSCTNQVKNAANYSYCVLALKDKSVIARSEERTITTTWMYHAKGTKYQYAGNNYKVITSSSGSKTVAFTGLVNKKTKNVYIPDCVQIDGMTYTVTQIAAKACRKNSNIRTLIVGGNITKIGTSAFESCKNISAIRIKGKKIKSVGKKAFKKTSSKLLINVPSSKVKTYKNMFVKAGLSKSSKVSK